MKASKRCEENSEHFPKKRSCFDVYSCSWKIESSTKSNQEITKMNGLLVDELMNELNRKHNITIETLQSEMRIIHHPDFETDLANYINRKM